MRKRLQPKKIRKRDYDRVLLTETLPYETPIVFSNDGLYRNIKRSNSLGGVIQRLLVENLVQHPNSKPTIPLRYKIRKNAIEFRRLSLQHPLSQWRVRLFY